MAAPKRRSGLSDSAAILPSCLTAGITEPLKIIVCSGGIARPTLAFWLARGGHGVVNVERFSTLRASGAQIDFRGQGFEVVTRMGFLDTGCQFVDSGGNAIRTPRPTTHILHDTPQADVEDVFRKPVESYKNDDRQFPDGRLLRYDLMGSNGVMDRAGAFEKTFTQLARAVIVTRCGPGSLASLGYRGGYKAWRILF
ncbi:uncharacterized protein DSM5745_03241 [Aspergillus mulundensis]|uniref:FAD-binding domain-containing protein n=1 Tax=Aspergillus mulundensis TaxID=1810919 RepID=A0A3D8SJS7_9EURO|nr:hypothetical protein DSM5745_03241 [Aspergillus mulundensis]RDW86599.1 hypothetical protein DSM5745_03241 [Aspergillus mulundensis]